MLIYWQEIILKRISWRLCSTYEACRTYDALARKTDSYTQLRDKAFEIANNPEYNWYQRALDSIFYRYFDKKFVDSEVTPNQQLADEPHKTIIRKLKYGK